MFRPENIYSKQEDERNEEERSMNDPNAATEGTDETKDMTIAEEENAEPIPAEPKAKKKTIKNEAKETEMRRN